MLRRSLTFPVCWMSCAVPAKFAPAPFACVHTASALPEGSTPIAGPEALAPGSEMVTGADHAPEAVLDEDWIRKTEPSERVQTAITSPLGATTTCGSNASWPAAGMSIEDSQVGVAC